MVANQHTLYLDDAKFNACKERGINLSLTLSKAVDTIMADEDFSYTLHLQYLSTIIKDNEDKLIELNNERKEIDKRLKTLKAEYKRIAKNYRIEEDSIALSKLLASLNNVIRASNYELIIIEESAKEILEKIYSIRSNFDLIRHIELLQETSSL